jgi:hypothetical protein
MSANKHVAWCHEPDGTSCATGADMTDEHGRPRVPRVRKEQPSTKLSREEFERRLSERLYDPAFDAVRDEIRRIMDVAWSAYHEYRKSPRTRKAGPGFADPDFELPVEWFATRDAIRQARVRHDDVNAPLRVLLISAAARSSETCPGESPKTYRLAQLAREATVSDAMSARASLQGPHPRPLTGRFISERQQQILCHRHCARQNATEQPA